MPRYTTAQRLRQVMSEKNLKQIDIVKLSKPLCERYRVFIGRNDISQYVAGKVEPRQNKLYMLAKTLNVNEAWLMGFDVPMEREHEEADSVADECSSILKKYNELNELGQKKLNSYADDLLVNPKYTTSNKTEQRKSAAASRYDRLEIAAYGGEGNKSPKKKCRETT